jgi:uncharacterized protein (DUF3084 family)
MQFFQEITEGVNNMKIGTSIFLLVMILIAFGYTMSDDRNVRADLNETRGLVEDWKSQAVTLNGKLATCQQAVQTDQQTITQQAAQINSLNQVISARDAEIGNWNALVSQQNGKINDLEGRLTKLAGQRNNEPTIQLAGWLHPNSLVLAALLTFQLISYIAQRKNRKDYVRLSSEERAVIIKMRRSGKVQGK